MKVPHVIAELVSEFSGFQHTPDFKASRSNGHLDEHPESAGHSSSSSGSRQEHQEHHSHSLYHGNHQKKKTDHLSVHFSEFLHLGRHNSEEHHHHSRPASGASTPIRKHSSSSQTHPKHSVHITVGADEVPTMCATPPNEPHQAHFVKHHNSSPNISRVASFSSLKEKLNKIKRTNSSDEEIECVADRKTSYRVVS